MASRFVKNRLFEQQQKADPKYRAGLRAHVQARVKPAVEIFIRQARAPWMPSGADPVAVEQDGDTVIVGNTDHAGHLQEWGSVNNPPHAPLRRGARAAGMRLDEQ